MSLLALPNEILGLIILEAMPENFESLTLSCKSLYSVCEPHFQRHNQLRRQFCHFKYAADLATSSHGICSAIELLCRIAREPIVARYIKKADFENDGSFPVGRDTIEPWTKCKGAKGVSGLLKNSPYLHEAGLDWNQYYNKMDEELTEVFYSQFAATFLLTLLPNVHTLIVPARWYLHEITAKLFALTSIRAGSSQTQQQQQQQLSQMHGGGASLAKVERFLTMTNLGEFADFDLDRHSMAFALPRLRHFRGTGCMAAQELGMADGVAHVSGLLRPPASFGAGLESLHLETCWIDSESLSQLLKRTPRLKTLRYSYRNLPRYRSKRWDPCGFVNTIAREVGKHLEELSVTTPPLTELGDFTPGKASLRGFERLRLLELSMDLVCLTMAGDGPGCAPSGSDKRVGDINGSAKGNFNHDVSGDVNGYIKGYVGGDVNGSVNGVIKGDVKGDVYGDINGSVHGNVRGSVNADVNGEIRGDVGGHVNGDVNGAIRGSVYGSVNGNISGVIMGDVRGRVRGHINGRVLGRVHGGSDSDDDDNDDNDGMIIELSKKKIKYSLLAELVPPTVTKLALVAMAMDEHAEALALLLRNFDVAKPRLVPALEELYVTEPPRGNKPSRYRRVWEFLSRQAARVGIRMAGTRQAGTGSGSGSGSRTVFDWHGL